RQQINTTSVRSLPLCHPECRNQLLRERAPAIWTARRTTRRVQKIEARAFVTLPRALDRTAIRTAPQKATICEDHAAVADTAIPCALAARIKICVRIPMGKMRN